jgi:hypothetical protein
MREGGDFKFRDYEASLGRKFQTGAMATPSRLVIDDLKFNIYDAYQALEKALK